VKIRTERAIVLAAILGVVGLTLWPGCATPPLPPTRRAISSLKRSDFNVVKDRHSTRGDLLNSIGEPDVEFVDLRVVGYKLNRVQHREVFLCLFVIPLGVWNSVEDLEVVLVQFDDKDKALRCTTRTGFDNMATLRALAESWVHPPPGK